jgi:hypothetical protein
VGIMASAAKAVREVVGVKVLDRRRRLVVHVGVRGHKSNSVLLRTGEGGASRDVGPDEGLFLIDRPSPGASRHPLPEGEGTITTSAQRRP